MDVKTDCFGYNKALSRCNVLTKLECEKCHFYKSKETVCDTCHNKGTLNCRKCRGK